MHRKEIRKTFAIILGLSLVFFTTSVIVEVHAKSYAFTATIFPTQVNINQLATYMVIITNTGEGSTLGSASIAIPTGFIIQSNVKILNPPTLWNYTLSATSIDLSADDGGSVMLQGENVTFTFDAIAPSSTMVANWTTEATTSINGGGVVLPLQGGQPKVTVTSSMYVPPTISASPTVINNDQVSFISQLTAVSGGIPPYTYQWLQAFDGGAFSPTVGANGLDFVFSPTIATPIGTWSFQLAVTDSSNPPQTVTSNTVNVLVNSALVASDVTATPSTVAQSQPSTLISSQITTGTSPYTYQWFQQAPGDVYTSVGGNAPSYYFPGSTTIGTWAFILQVTDGAGASVNSSSVTVAVTSTPVFTITVTQNAHGTINPGTVSVSYGNDQSFVISANVGYYIADVLVDGASVGAVTSYVFTFVSADHTVTANFAASSSMFYINVTSSFGTPTPSAQVNAGDSFSVSVTSPEGDTSHRWICTGFSIDGGASVSGTSYVFADVQADHTITFNWQEQYYLTVISPVGSTTGAGWYNVGTTTAVSVSSTVSTGSDTREVFAGWGGDASGAGLTSDLITIDSAKTATATWETQYQVTYATSGNVLEVIVPSTEWVDSGSSATGTFPTLITDPAGSTRAIFVTDNRPSVVNQPLTVTGTYQNQYLVTFSQNGLDNGASGIVVTALNDTKTFDHLPESIWINAGESITFSYIATVETTETGKQYILTNSNSTSPLKITEPTTIQGSYQLQLSSSGFALDTLTLTAIIATVAIPASVTVPIVIRRRGGKKKKIKPIPGEGGGISPSTLQTIDPGGDSTVFIITANDGFRIDDVVIDNAVHLGAVRTYKFVNVTKNHTISAIFRKH